MTPVHLAAVAVLVLTLAAFAWQWPAVDPRRQPWYPGLRERLAELARTVAVERRLLGLLRPRWRAVLGGLGVTVALTVVGLARPWPTKILVDDVLGDGRLGGLGTTGALAVAVGLTVALFLLSGGLGLAQTRVLFGLSQHLLADLRARLFGHLARLSLRYHDAHGTGDALYRVTTDTYAVQSILLDGLVPLSAAVLTLVGTLAVMVALDPGLALLSLLGVPGAVVVSRRYGSRIRNVSTDVAERESDVYAQAELALTGIRTVQAFGRESYEADRFAARAQASRGAMLRLVTQQTVFGLAVDFVLAAGLAVVTWVAAQRALSGALSTGEVLVFLAYAGTLYGPVAGLASVFGELQSAAAGAQRVFEVLDQPQPVEVATARAPRHRAAGHVRFEAVTFGYTPGVPVLHGVDLAADPGRVVALVGPTGAGKSTIVSLLLRLYDVDGGRVTLDGVDVRDLPLSWLRAQVAFVPQDPVLFPVTVAENIRYGRLDATDAEVEQAASAANVLGEVALDTVVGDRGATLSGGQRQRVAIARAFLKDAPIVVLDEPTSALDAATEALVMDAIARLLEPRTGIVIAHRLATVHSADEVLVIEAGRVVQHGSHRLLVRRHGLYRQLHQARFGREAQRRPAAVRA